MPKPGWWFFILENILRRHRVGNPKKQIRNIYGYCRVSTIEQAENGISVDTQQELITEFVRDKFNKEVSEWFIDAGVSGTVPILERARCREMTDVMDEYDVIVSTRIDRLSRSCNDLLATIPKLEACGVTLYLCEQFGDMPIVYPKDVAAKGLDAKYDMNSLVNQIMLMVLSAVAEMEFENTKKKFAEGKISWAERGYSIGGSPPFGYCFQEEKLKHGNRMKIRKKLVEVPEEQAVLKTIRLARKRGLGARKIAKQVENTHKGFEKFSPTKVQNILKRKYQGLVPKLH